MLDAQKLTSQTLEALLVFWQQHAGVHRRAGASRRLTVGPAVGFEWHTITASELHSTIWCCWLCIVTFCAFKKTDHRSHFTVGGIIDFSYSF
jgi:hypothetical protein